MNTKKTYGDKLLDPRWQQKRTQILTRDGFCCRTCSDPSSTLEIHHLSYRGEPWEVPDDQLVTLCRHCHRIVSYFGINILTQLESPFPCCFKTDQSTGTLCFFQHTRGFIICIVEGYNIHEIINMREGDLRNLIQIIINNWLGAGKDHLLIDQSPIHYGT